MEPDLQQMEYDLADAKHRLERIRRAAAKKEEADTVVRTLQAQLRDARRAAKEASWDLSFQQQQGTKP